MESEYKSFRYTGRNRKLDISEIRKKYYRRRKNKITIIVKLIIKKIEHDY